MLNAVYGLVVGVNAGTCARVISSVGRRGTRVEIADVTGAGVHGDLGRSVEYAHPHDVGRGSVITPARHEPSGPRLGQGSPPSTEQVAANNPSTSDVHQRRDTSTSKPGAGCPAQDGTQTSSLRPNQTFEAPLRDGCPSSAWATAGWKCLGVSARSRSEQPPRPRQGGRGAGWHSAGDRTRGTSRD